MHFLDLFQRFQGIDVPRSAVAGWRDVRLEPAHGAKFGYLTVRASRSKNAKKRNVAPDGFDVEVAGFA